MKFLEAVAYAYKNRRRDEDITTPTVFHSILSDLCGASYEDKKKLKMFYTLDKQYGIMSTLCNSGASGIRQLTAAFHSDNQISADKFKKLLESVSVSIGLT